MPEINSVRWVNLGPVGRSLGVHGAFFIPESTLEGPALKRLKSLRFGENAPLEEVVEAARHGAGLKLRVARITSPEVAKTLQGKSVWVERSVLPPAEPGSYYHFDLLGLPVFSDEALVGKLARIEAVPGGVDRWWVETASGLVAVPASRRFLKTVDPAAGRIEVLEWSNLRALGGLDSDDGIQ